MSNVATRKATEAAQRAEARIRACQYQRKVVEPEIAELSAELFPIIMAEHGHDDGERSSKFEVTLSVDGRYKVLDPDHPYPDVESRQYRIHVQKNYYKHEFYVHVETWRLVPNWAGHYNPRGSEKWDGVDQSWHKLQVLRALLKKESWDCPETLEGATTVLLRFMERVQDQMTDQEKAALICFQDSRRDPASSRKKRA